MNILCRMPIVLALLFASNCWSNPPEELAEKIEVWLEEYHIPSAAVAVFDNGKLEWIEEFGDIAAGVRTRRDAIFNIASLTKPVFGMMVLNLIEKGELDLDTPISEFWTDPDVEGNAYVEALTPRIILSHQSGFPNWRGNKKLSFDFEPGTKHGYSGEGFEFLRRALESKTGIPLAELIREHVIKKAGMTDTYLGWDDALSDKLADFYEPRGEPVSRESVESRKPNAASNMFMTIRDYARFSSWVLAKADLSESMFKEMQRQQSLHSDPVDPFGLSWKLTQVGDETIIWHDGREKDLFTQMVLWPERRQGIVVFTNGKHGELFSTRLIAEATTSGRDYLRNKLLDTNKFFLSLSDTDFEGVLKVVLDSPTFTRTLLGIFESLLPSDSSLSDAERVEAGRQFDQLVHSMIRKGLDPNTSATIREFATYTKKENGLNDEQFRSFVALIRSIATETASN